MEAESIDAMLTRVGADFARRAKALTAKASGMDHDPAGQAKVLAKAATWSGYANFAAAKGTFPINGADPQLSLIFGPERQRAMKAGAYIMVDSRTATVPRAGMTSDATDDGVDNLTSEELALLDAEMDFGDAGV